MSNQRAEDMAKLALESKRQLGMYSNGAEISILAMYLDEALTGWAAYIEKPEIGEFKNIKCVCVPLSTWVLIKTLGAETVTPFRVVARGKNLIIKGFMPHTGLKYAVREIGGTPKIMIPIEDFSVVKNSSANTSKA